MHIFKYLSTFLQSNVKQDIKILPRINFTDGLKLDRQNGGWGASLTPAVAYWLTRARVFRKKVQVGNYE